ncbi:MAG TPA: GerMN domain-containing protein, partial [Chloroflexota bacterium]|nr:GerMN domain-containing protein [Chloroflexota bacterium]
NASVSAGASSSAAGTVNAAVYFEADGTLVAEQAKVDGADPLRQALQALLKGPAQPGHYTDIPQGTKLLDVNVASGGAATVSLSAEFFASGGSTAAEMRTGQIVYTVTGFPTVQSVRILEQGQPATLGEGLNVAQPLTRQSLHGVTAASPNA